MRWIIDGNNVFGSRPDGWWNNRDAASARFAQQVAEWCRRHDDDVTIVFDAPLSADAAVLAGGNLTIVESDRRGRDAADDTIARLAEGSTGSDLTVVTSDRGLRARLPESAGTMGAGRFLAIIEH